VQQQPLKRRVWRPLEKWLINRPVRALLRLGIAPSAFALLETTGRRSGRLRLTPVGNGLDGSVFWLVAIDRRCDYLKNLVADSHVRVKVRRRWYRGVATVVADDDAWVRRRSVDRVNGLLGRIDGAAFRAGAGEPVTVRVDLRELD